MNKPARELTEDQLERRRAASRRRYHSVTPEQKELRRIKVKERRDTLGVGKLSPEIKQARREARLLLKPLLTPEEVKESRARAVAKSIGKKQAWFEQYKASLSCNFCGESDPDLFEFHHLNPEEKDRGIAYLARGCSLKRLKAELDKTICLCASCHRKLHAELRKESGGPHTSYGTALPKWKLNKIEQAAATKAWIEEYKIQHGCAKCGQRDPLLLDFHHINPLEKEWNISRMLSTGLRVDRVQAEVSKTICLCVLCHRKLHAVARKNDNKEGAEAPSDTTTSDMSEITPD